MDNEFRYDSQLSGEEIRLLNLPPNDSAVADSVSFTLSTAPLSEATKYYALSYVWGNEDPDRTITINGFPFAVRPRLDRVLAQLRGKIPYPIWTDAICINQDNDDEKGVQILIMRKIYEYAKKTIIWLGEADGSSDAAMAYLDDIGKNADKAGILKLTEDDFLNWAETEENREREAVKAPVRALLEESYQRRIKALLALSERVWFSRVWVVQELSVSTDYEFWCGDAIVAGDRFIAGYQILLLSIAEKLAPTRGLNLYPSTPNPNLDIPSPRAMRTLGTRKQYQNGRPEKTPMTLMHHLSRAFVLDSAITLQATEPKDRVYALLGLAPDHPRPPVRQDKSIGYPVVYAETAKLLVQHGHLDILSLCRPIYAEAKKSKSVAESLFNFFILPKAPRSQRHEALPSWAPDWSQPILIPWGGLKEDGLFHASGSYGANDDDPYTTGLEDNRDTAAEVLAIRARPFGNLMVLGSSWNLNPRKGFECEDWGAALTLLNQIETMVIHLSCRYLPAFHAEALWRIPIGDRERNDLGMLQRATERSQVEFNKIRELYPSIVAQVNTQMKENFFWTVVRQIRCTVNNLFWYPFIHPFLVDTSEPASVPNVASYMGSLKEICGAKPFMSNDGWVGLCPADSKKEDEIWFPQGAHVPYVLRKEGKKVDGPFRYKLIGEAYVYGLMDGGMSTLRPEFKDLQTLHLV
jgi:hypothetical protein